MTKAFIIILYILLISRIIHHVFCILYTAYWLKYNKKTEYKNDTTKIHIFIPLLRETSNFDKLITRFTYYVEQYPFVKLILVTTQREYIEPKQKKTTIDQISEWMKSAPEHIRKNTQHIHYPYHNRNLAEQINYAIKQIVEKIPNTKIEKSFIAVYNADSNPGHDLVNVFLHEKQKTHGTVFQQSSTFLQNLKAMTTNRNLFGIANGLFQTVWTHTHEIPRLLKNKHLPNTQLAHCVTHGMFIRADVLKKIKYFPTDSHGEDLYLGFILRSHGVPILPLPLLEESKTPNKLYSILKQKYVWFWGPLGYFFYWNRIRNSFPKTWRTRYFYILTLAAQGILSASNWLLVSFFFMFVIYLDIAGHMPYGILLACIYFWIPSLLTLHTLRNKHASNLTVLMSLIFFYPMVVLTHSFPAYKTIYHEIKYRLIGWSTFLRPKTE